jgi:NAD(P)-dependent dehydrogenase (short-subunit alcohol dehydrogenase family)
MSGHEGVTAIVGGSRGTGAALARMLLESDQLVVIGYAEKDVRAKRVAGLLDERRQPVESPKYGDRAVVSQVDVTDMLSRLSFAEEAKRFAEEHDTTVSTLALLGAAGIGQPSRITFAVNQEGQIHTARTFWETVGETADPVAMTLFAQSFQGHTAFHPSQEARAEYPDDYAPVALSKWNGEIGLRLLNQSLNSQEYEENRRHILAVIVGDALGDSDPIKLLKRRADQAADRIATGEGRDGDEEMVRQMSELGKRDEELMAVGFEPVTTEDYADLMKDVIANRYEIPAGVNQVTEYIPEKAVVNGTVVDLESTGNPLDWAHGAQRKIKEI